MLGPKTMARLGRVILFTYTTTTMMISDDETKRTPEEAAGDGVVIRTATLSATRSKKPRSAVSKRLCAGGRAHTSFLRLVMR